MTKDKVLESIKKEMKVFGMREDLTKANDSFVSRAITVVEWTDVLFGVLIGCGSEV